MLLLFIRHGETYRNLDPGHKMNTLTPRGMRQVALLAKRLSTYKPKLIISSRMERAIATAVEIKKYHPRVRSVKDEDFNEISGTVVGNSFTKHPRSRMAADKKRADRALSKLRKLKHDCIILAIHGNLIRYFLTKILGIPSKKAGCFRTDNASLTAVTIKNGNATIILLNGRKHLPKRYVSEHSHYLE